MEILHSKITGDKPQHLLIFHGLFGQSDNWASLAKQFAENFTVHAVDLRNHGRSFHSDNMNFDENVEDILNYLKFHQIERAHMIGHSLGGRIVIEFAYHHPDKVHKLIVADMAPKAYPPHHQGILKALNAVDFNTIEKRSDVEDVLKNYIPDMGTRQFLLKNVYHADNGQYAFRFNLKTLTQEYETMVGNNLTDGRFEGPTLFLRGAKSNYIEDHDFMMIKTHFPNSIVETVSNAGHWLHAENPTEFYQKSTEFLLN